MVTSVLDYLNSVVKTYPDKMAYADMQKEFTFSEVTDCAKRIASSLAEFNVLHKPVVIFMKRSVYNIVSFWGCAYAGAFYVPIDMDMPEARVKLIVDLLKPEAVIYDGDTEQKVLNDEIWAKVHKLKYDDAVKESIKTEELENIKNNIKTTDILYVLFTSGSTGVPKGVTISHGAVIDCIDWMCEEYKFDSTAVFCNQAPFYFDVSLSDIYVPAKVGASLYIPPKMYYSFPKKILQFMEEKGVNTLVWVPSALCNVVNCNAFEVCVPTKVRLVIFAGEVMPIRHLNVWRKYIPDALYVNQYGPTEATYACIYYNIDRPFTEGEKLPIGKACGNCEILLLKEDGTLARGDELGEICVLGQCLSNGYYNNPEKTKEVFVQNPLNKNWMEMMYKTGDLARIDSDGNLIYEGRKDFQIKRLGHRIELGEIENAILSFDEIKQACCVFNQETSDLIAVYAGSLNEKELHERLKEKLPPYMLPTHYYQRDSIPMTLNGKVDRVSLKKQYTEGK